MKNHFSRIFCFSVVTALSLLTFACHDPNKDQNSNDAYDQNGKNYGSSNLESDSENVRSTQNNRTQRPTVDSTNYNNPSNTYSNGASATGGTTSMNATSNGTTGSTTSGSTGNTTSGASSSTTH